jgi:N-acetyl-gamma-glutamyl-phosphate reductase
MPLVSVTPIDQAKQPAKTQAKTKVGIVGATGYTGQELVRLLLQHPSVDVKSATTQSYKGKKYADVYPGFAKLTDIVCAEENIDALADQVDVMFLALPHGNAAEKISPAILKKCVVIDLGGDFRLKDQTQYPNWYQFEHPQPELLASAVYGLPELNREAIVGAQLVANPGCYATCSILTLAPLVKSGLVNPDSIIIDALSGVSGAGRSPAIGSHFNECNESVKAYKVASHRHTPEIEQALGNLNQSQFTLSFTPHLVPMNRGILVTAYASLINGVSQKDVSAAYEDMYGSEPFIRLCDPESKEFSTPETRWVKGSNFCDIAVTLDQRTNRVIAIGAIDNLVKGAAGQAIQNMNLVCGWEETTGLMQPAIFPA